MKLFALAAALLALALPAPVRAAAYPSTYTPKSLAGCVLWLDASDTSTQTIATGVSQWNDKCSTNNVTQATGANQPTTTTVTGFSGQTFRALSFNGTSQFLNKATSTLPSGATPDFTAFAVVTYADDAANHVMFGWGAYDGGENMIALGISANTNAYLYTGDSSWIAGIFEKATPQLVTWKSTAGTYATYQNGDALAPTGTGAPVIPATPPLYIGVFNNGSQQWWKSTIMEIIVYSRALSDDERSMVGGYLCWKWAFQADCAGYNTAYANNPPYGWLWAYGLLPAAGIYPGGR